MQQKSPHCNALQKYILWLNNFLTTVMLTSKLNLKNMNQDMTLNIAMHNQET